MRNQQLSGAIRNSKGERGAQEISNLMQGFQNPQSIAQERFVMNSIMGHFGGTPTTSKLGLSGGEAAAYGQMVETQKLQYIMQKLPELSMSNPGLLMSLVQGVGKGAGTGMQSMMAQAFFPGMNAAKLGAFHSSLYDTLRGKGVDESRLQGMETLDLWAEVMRRSPTEGRQILNGTISTGTLTDVERARTLDKMNLESWSSKFSSVSLPFRLGVKGAKDAGLEFIDRATNLTKSLLGGGVGNVTREAFTADEDTKQENRLREMEREMMYSPSGGSIYRQSYGGESMSVEPIQVTGSIQLISDGGSVGELPAQAISLLIQKAIQEQSGTPRAGAPSRPRLLAPRI